MFAKNAGLVALLALSFAACHQGPPDTGTDTDTTTNPDTDTTSVTGVKDTVTVTPSMLGSPENCTGNFDAMGDDANSVSHPTSQTFQLVHGETFDFTVGDLGDTTSYGLPIHTDAAHMTWITTELSSYKPTDGEVLSPVMVPYFGGQFTCTRHVWAYDSSQPDFKGADEGTVPDDRQHIEVLANYRVKADDRPGMGTWGDEDYMQVEFKPDDGAYHLVLHDEAPTYGTSITDSTIGKDSFDALVVDPDNEVVDISCSK